MIKIKRLDTTIRIERPVPAQDSYGGPKEEWRTVGADTLLCEWRNAHGKEAWLAHQMQAKQPATIRLWFPAEFGQLSEDEQRACRIIKLPDETAYSIVSVDNVENRGIVLEMKLQRWSGNA